MRVRFGFTSSERFTLLWNYQQYFNVSWNKLIRQMYFEQSVSPEMNEFFKYLDETNLHCMSRLLLPNHTKVKKNEKGIEGVSTLFLICSTPYEQASFESIQQQFLNKKFLFHLEKQVVCLTIERLALMEERFDTNTFTCISPMVLLENPEKAQNKCITYEIGKPNEHFLSTLKHNLLKKYQQVHNKDFTEEFDLDFRFCEDYVNKRDKNITKLIKYESLTLRGYEAPFYLKAPAPIIETAYKCGIGDFNHNGFGCIEGVNTLSSEE